jgi:hypothetical protein
MLLEITKDMTAVTEDQANVVHPDTDEDDDHDNQVHVMDIGCMGSNPVLPCNKKNKTKNHATPQIICCS